MGQARADGTPQRAVLDKAALVQGLENGPWLEENVPLFDCADAQIREIYYYRWDCYRMHLRRAGGHWIVTEFLPHVPWEGPYGSIDAAAGHHIYEGRWLRDRRYMDGTIDFWLSPDSGARRYSSWLADAVYQYTLATGDTSFAVARLKGLEAYYDGWIGHFDASKGLYWQVPSWDATEYSASSLDVGDGFAGDSFRPTLNAYQFAGAKAISAIAGLAGDTRTRDDYAHRAAALKRAVQTELWNPAYKFFMDRFSPRYPDRYFQFASAPESAGFVPWYFQLPDPEFAVAWSTLMDPKKFYAPFGPRTLWPDSPYYMIQHRTPGAQPGECEWNGPSWPFMTSFILGGLANLLDSGTPAPVTRDDYFHLLRQYTLEQYKDGKPWIAEDLNPDTGAWIADFPNRSERYNHSTYADLIITGLAGLRPRGDAVLEVAPLIPDSMAYLCLEDVPYHGRRVTILWDRVDHYGRGNGLKVYVDGTLLAQRASLGRLTASLPTLPR